MVSPKRSRSKNQQSRSIWPIEVRVDRKTITPETWQAFRDCGLLWWVNRGLHLFGWAIVLEFGNGGEFIAAYPARTIFRGFDEQSETNGFRALTRHIADNAPSYLKDVEEE